MINNSNKKNPKKAILVLGMHRSGTSAMAGVLNILGVDLGQTFLAPNEFNEKGYWEHADINDTHERLLAKLDSSWDDIYSLPENWWHKKEVEPFCLEIIHILKKDFSNSPLWGIKDPRLCRLLPLWKVIFSKLNCDPCFIIISRHPYEVAKSLAKRDGFLKEKSYILWLEHVIEVEKETREFQRMFINYDHLFNDWRSVLEQIASNLSLTWPKDPSEVSDEINRFLLPALRHHKAAKSPQPNRAAALEDQQKKLHQKRSFYRVIEKKPLEDFKNQSHIYSLVVSVYEVIKEAGFAKNELDILSKVYKEFEKIKELASPFLQVGKAEIDNRDAAIKQAHKHHRDEASSLYGNIRELREELDKLSTWGHSLDKVIEQKDKLIIDLNRKVTKLATWGQELDKDIKHQKKIINSLNKSLKSKNIKSIQPSELMEYDDIYDEAPYLEANPDVAEAVKKGEFNSGYEHWVKHGLSEYKASIRQPGFIDEHICLESNLVLKSWLKNRELDNGTNINEPFTIETAEDPLVTIVIPAYNNVEFTYQCLKSIKKNRPINKFEIIVIDDASSDATRDVLSRIVKIRYIRNKINRGFIRSCNRGASKAKGKYILFLNSDTEVFPGWLDELVNTFNTFPDAGLVGSKLISPVGSLQEAGAIVRKDGSAWNYGRMDDPGKPEYNYLRQVDYVSAASMMVPADLFQELGGFDEIFNPAHSEDSDLAFKIRNRGLKTFYQPLSQVIHFEGMSHGTDVSSVGKAHQPSNIKKMFNRWRRLLEKPRNRGFKTFYQLLSQVIHFEDMSHGTDVSTGGKAHQLSNTKEMFERRRDALEKHGTNTMQPFLDKDRGVKARILVIDACTPTPDRDAGSNTMIEVMRIFQSLSHKVTFIPADNLSHFEKYTTDLQRIGIECIYRPYTTSVENFLKKNNDIFNVVLIARHEQASNNLPLIRKYCPQAKIIYYPVDLHYLREKRQAEVEQSETLSSMAMATRTIEFGVIAQADCTMVCSSKEREILLKEMPDKFITMFPWIRRVKENATDFEHRRDIAFIGGYQHNPNVDAVVYFVQEIFPLVQDQLSSVKFRIFGSNAPQEVLDLACNDVIIHGFIPDLADCLTHCRITVAPLRYGAGIKGKIVSSMAYGVPCVVSSIAAEGMNIKTEEEVLIADDPQSFTESIVRLYTDKKLWTRLSGKGLRFVEDHYSWKVGKKILEKTLRVLYENKTL